MSRAAFCVLDLQPPIALIDLRTCAQTAKLEADPRRATCDGPTAEHVMAPERWRRRRPSEMASRAKSYLNWLNSDLLGSFFRLEFNLQVGFRVRLRATRFLTSLVALLAGGGHARAPMRSLFRGCLLVVALLVGGGSRRLFAASSVQKVIHQQQVTNNLPWELSTSIGGDQTERRTTTKSVADKSLWLRREMRPR